MTNRRLLAAILAAATTAAANVVISSVVETFQWRNPFGSHGPPDGFEATCEATGTFKATQHIVQDINEPLPVGLAPWGEAIPYFFGGRPYPGTWDGVDHKGAAREVMKMEYLDLPALVREWIATQDREKANENRYLFGVYDKPAEEGQKVKGISKKGTGVDDENKIVLFAAGSLYDILPLFVAEGSSCPDELKDLTKYKAWEEDGAVVAWPVERTSPDRAGNNTEIEFKIKAQVVRETEEGRVARLAREKEEEEERKKQEEEARKQEEEEAKKGEEEAKKGEEEKKGEVEQAAEKGDANQAEETVARDEL